MGQLLNKLFENYLYTLAEGVQVLFRTVLRKGDVYVSLI